METMRKMMIAALLLLSLGIQAQDFEKIRTAFAQSYTYESEKKYVDAVKAIESVYDNQNYEMNLRLGYLHYLNAQYSKSTEYYQKAIDVRPMSIEARLGYALPASALGNWDKVRIKYEEILKIDPENSVVNYRLGLMCYYSADYEKARSYFEKVINHYPFDYDSMLMLAWCNLKLGKISDARLLFQKVLLYSPSDSSATEGLKYTK